MHPRERYKIIPEVYVLLVRDGEILLGRRFNTGWMDGMYGLPGGHGEDKESVRMGAAREGLEELGIDFDPKGLALVHVQHRWSPDPNYPHGRIGYYFVPTNWSGEYKNNEPEKCDNLQFFSFDALPSNIIPHIREALLSWQRGEFYDEFDWHTLAV